MWNVVIKVDRILLLQNITMNFVLIYCSFFLVGAQAGAKVVTFG